MLGIGARIRNRYVALLIGCVSFVSLLKSSAVVIPCRLRNVDLRPSSIRIFTPRIGSVFYGWDSCIPFQQQVYMVAVLVELQRDVPSDKIKGQIHVL